MSSVGDKSKRGMSYDPWVKVGSGSLSLFEMEGELRLIIVFENISSSIILFSMINFNEIIVFSLITEDILCNITYD